MAQYHRQVRIAGNVTALLICSSYIGLSAAAAQTPLSMEEVTALRDEVAKLREEVATLRAEQQKPAPATATPTPPVTSWKGAPQFEDRQSGFTFKPKGTIQLDAGYLSIPGSNASGTVGPRQGGFGAAGVNSNNLGFNTRLRSAIIGAEGTLPGGFGYNVEFDLAQSSIGYEDVILTYQAKDSPVQLRLGYQFPLSGLELMTSRRFTSFTERAGEIDSFGEVRRIGLSASYTKKDILLSAGIFGDDVANTNFNRTGWQGSFRGVWFPKFNDFQGHLGVNLQYRTAPRDAQSIRYRQRPYTQITDQRLIDTGRIAGDGDIIGGIELAGIYKQFHFAAEGQKLWVRGYNDPSRSFGANNGTGGNVLFPSRDPSFFSGYAELGLLLTGESRGYRAGRWDRTKVLKPFGSGGSGAFQINARLDYSDLNDQAGAGIANRIDGGQMTSYAASLIWFPTDYVKFIAQYNHVLVDGGPSALPPFAQLGGEYGLDLFALRAQVDF
jgi:phosphate-selective porin OprO and OprP